MSTRIAIVGPTATGKSDLALDLADRLGGPEAVEIVNADASQLYRGMDVGTAKVPVGERRGYAHHLIDVLDVRQEATVAAYQTAARTALAGIEARGRRAIIVGGSGLYARAVTDGLVFPGTDAAVRSRLEARAEVGGTRALWEELGQVDPVSAAHIEPSNTRKIVRALEVVEVTGQPFSATLPRYEDAAPTLHLALRPDRALLNCRIDVRAMAMFAGAPDAGLVAETARLLEQGLREGPTASRAIGYAQAIAVLDGVCDLGQAVADTAQATRRLASRQLKWFRRDPRIHWIDVALGEGGSLAVEKWERVVDAAHTLVGSGPAPAEGGAS